jgi:hypothetical protein
MNKLNFMQPYLTFDLRPRKLVEAPREEFPAPPSHYRSRHRLGFF